MAQTVRIKPAGWCCADDVQGFTTTRVVGLDAQNVYVAGELDLNSNAEATAAFTIAVGAGLPIVVDLTDLDFMDCGEHLAIALTITHAQGEQPRATHHVRDRRGLGV